MILVQSVMCVHISEPGSGTYVVDFVDPCADPPDSSCVDWRENSLADNDGGRTTADAWM